MPSKYRAVPTVVDGIRFASKKEAKRYAELRLRERAGEIKNLRAQVKFDFEVNNARICTYVADFVYHEPSPSHPVSNPANWVWAKLVVEDTKGFKTPVYRLKKKLMKAVHGIEIRET